MANFLPVARDQWLPIYTVTEKLLRSTITDIQNQAAAQDVPHDKLVKITPIWFSL